MIFFLIARCPFIFESSIYRCIWNNHIPFKLKNYYTNVLLTIFITDQWYDNYISITNILNAIKYIQE